MWWQTIKIHHECPCRTKISPPRGRNFNQGKSLPSPWLNSDPEGEISLSYMARLMMGFFLSLFQGFCWNKKINKERENFNFSLVGFTLFPSSKVFLLGMTMGVNIVCTLLLTGKHDWSISSVAKCKIKSCYAPCAVSITLPILSCDASVVIT